MTLDISLNHSVAVVTGGGSGIGRAIALLAARTDAGAVVVIDRDVEAGERTADDIDGLGVPTLSMAADVSDPVDCQRAVGDAVERFGSVDVLVNSAGIVRDAQFHTMDPEEWDAVLAVNLGGTYAMCQAVAASMVDGRGGSIINIASRSLLGNFGQTNYSASKAAVVGLTRSLAIELGPHNVRANAIAPGYIETPIMRGVPDSVRERAARAAPLRRVGTPEDVAPTAVFLASDAASYVTGQCLFVCGGRSLGGSLEIWS